MILKEINGSNYIKIIPYKVICSGGDDDNPALKISFTGEKAEFNRELLKTTEDNLGIQLSADNKKIALGSNVLFVYKEPPKFSITPIVNSNFPIKLGGSFTSSVVVKLDYQ